MLTKSCTSCLVLIFCSIHVNCKNVIGNGSANDLFTDSDGKGTSFIYQQYGDGPAQLFYLNKHEQINGFQLPPVNFSIENKSEKQQVHLQTNIIDTPFVRRPQKNMFQSRLRERPHEDVTQSTVLPNSLAKLITELHSPQLSDDKPHRLNIDLPVRTNVVDESVEEDKSAFNFKKLKPKVNDDKAIPLKISLFPTAEIVGMSLYKGFNKPTNNVPRPLHSEAYSGVPYTVERPPQQFITAGPVMDAINKPKQYHFYSVPLAPPPLIYTYPPPQNIPRPKAQTTFYSTTHNVPPHVRTSVQHFSHPFKPPPPPPPIFSHPNRTHKKKLESKSEEASSEKKIKHKSHVSKKKHSKDDSDVSDGSESVEKNHKHGHKSGKKDEQDSFEASEKGFEKSGGSKYNEEERKKKGWADSKEYNHFDSFGKGKKGHYDEEDYYEFDDSKYGKKASKDQHGHKHAANKGENSGKFDEKKSHKKGSKTTGYHNVFHKDEYKKVHTFYDDADHKGKFKKYGSDHSQHESDAAAVKSNNHHKSDSDEHNDEIKRKTKKGVHSTEDTGYGWKYGNDRHHSDEKKHSKKGGKRHKHERGRKREHEEND